MADYYGYIYRTTNLINGSTYIGQHCGSSFDEKYFGSGVILAKAIKKYGIDNFKVEVIEFCEDKTTLNSKEIYYIALEKKNTENKCYNIALGGNGGNTLVHMTKEQYENFCEKSRGSNNGMYGKGYKLLREKNGRYGKKLTEDQKENFRGSNNGMYGKGHLISGEKNGFYGKTHSNSSKLKMSKDRKGHKNARSRMILVDFVEANCKMIFSTMEDAIIVLGSNRSTITHHVKTGKIRKSMGLGRKSIAPHYISYLGRGD